MAEKRCFKCGFVKDIECFYKHPQMADGRLGKCKECTKRDVSTNYDGKREQYAAYEREREKLPERRAQKTATQRRHRAKHPDKYIARTALASAIKSGKVERGPCEVCGVTERVQAHHDDYSKPLDVRWFCFLHHRHDAHGQKPVEGERDIRGKHLAAPSDIEPVERGGYRGQFVRDKAAEVAAKKG